MAAYCTNCASALEPGVKFCGSCGAQIEAPAPNPPSHDGGVWATARSSSAAGAAGRRYPALRIVAIILKVAAGVWAIIGVIGFIATLAVGSDLPRGLGAASSLYGLFFLLTSAYFAVMSWAGAELLHVFMDIEENTRRFAAK